MNKNKKIITSIVLAAMVLGTVGYASADETTISNMKMETRKMMKGNFNFDHDRFDFDSKDHFKKGRNGNIKGLTDEEKNSLEDMTDEEKKSFFEAKRSEKQAEREVKKAERENFSNVIDKLLAGETLTSDEEVTRAIIITKKAERKIQMEERQAKMEEIKIIIEKKKAGETLTTDEETKLEEMKSEFKGNKGGSKRGNHSKGEGRGFGMNR